MLRYLQDRAYLKALPDAARAAASEVIQQRPPFHRLADWTLCSQLHGPRVVLVGDAAKSGSPALGQGVNSGLEDAQIFTQVMHCMRCTAALACPDHLC